MALENLRSDWSIKFHRRTFIKTFQSAIKTKFEQHITNGEEIVKYLSSLLKDLNESAKQISAISFDESGKFYSALMFRIRFLIG